MSVVGHRTRIDTIIFQNDRNRYRWISILPLQITELDILSYILLAVFPRFHFNVLPELVFLENYFSAMIFWENVFLFPWLTVEIKMDREGNANDLNKLDQDGRARKKEGGEPSLDPENYIYS